MLPPSQDPHAPFKAGFEMQRGRDEEDNRPGFCVLSPPSAQRPPNPGPKPARPPGSCGLQVLFCGRDMHFGFQFTREALEGEPGVRVVQCDRAAIPEELASADVVVPLMSRLDAPVRATAASPPERLMVLPPTLLCFLIFFLSMAAKALWAGWYEFQWPTACFTRRVAAAWRRAP
jgi:hypothetical protein